MACPDIRSVAESYRTGKSEKRCLPCTSAPQWPRRASERFQLPAKRAAIVTERPGGGFEAPAIMSIALSLEASPCGGLQAPVSHPPQEVGELEIVSSNRRERRLRPLAVAPSAGRRMALEGGFPTICAGHRDLVHQARPRRRIRWASWGDVHGNPAAQGLSEHPPPNRRRRSQLIRVDRGAGRSPKLPRLRSVPLGDRRHGEAVGDDSQPPTDGRPVAQSARRRASPAEPDRIPGAPRRRAGEPLRSVIAVTDLARQRSSGTLKAVREWRGPHRRLQG